MTLPVETQLPLSTHLIRTGNPTQLMEYMRELVRKLQENYRNMAQNINGEIRDFPPVMMDTDTATTYTYTHQIGWYFRQGLMVDYWFDVLWTAIDTGTPTGDLYVQLPYEAFDVEEKPFVGVLQTSTLAYGAGLTTLTINAIPATFRGEIWGSGSAAATANVTANTSAGQLIGHIRYVGIEYERG